VGGYDEGPLPGELVQFTVDERCRVGVEARERLVEQHELRVVEERAAEGEALLHPAREGRDPGVALLPEAEALEQHADALAPFRDAVEAAVELEVLERGELAVDERLVREVADRGALGEHLELAAARRREAGEQAQQRGLARAVRAGEEEKPTGLEVEVEPAEDPLLAVALRE
jgi:hypothetical protein